MRTSRTRGNGRKSLVTVVAATLVLLSAGMILPRATQAEIRVRAGVHTPNLDLEIRTGRDYPPAPRPVPIRHRSVIVQPPVYVVITGEDKAIAKRLSAMTGYRKHLLLDLRRDGLGWYRIGAILEIPPRLVRVAMAPRPPRHAARHHRPPRVCRGR